MPVQIYDVHRQDRGSSLKLTFLIKNQYSLDMTGCYMTEPYVVNRLSLVRFKFEQNISHNSLHASNVSEYPISLMISTKLAPNHRNPKLTTDRKTILNVTCKAVGYFEQLVCTENWTEWLIMGQKTGTLAHKMLTFEPIHIAMVTSQTNAVSFANLYDDVDLTDFYLSTPGERVAVHKACLAAHSDVFRAMLSKEWKETGDAQINLEGITLKTLEYLKKYIYLGTLPDDDEVLRQLLTFASCYMMDTLKMECISKICSQTTGDNLHSLVEYACENNLPELMIAVIEQIPDSVIKRAHDKRWHKLCGENSSQFTVEPNLTLDDNV